MEKQIVKKIISLAIIFTFAMFFIQITSPFSAQGATNQGLDWNNPNKNNNPYSLKLNNPLKDPSFYMQVVGCTGVVNKLAKAILWFQNPYKTAEIALDKLVEAADMMCATSKGGATTAVASAYGLNFTDAVDKNMFCNDITGTKLTGEAKRALVESKKATSEQNVVENCLAGMAITMAKNQLTAMTRYTMNWVNSGFEGNPLYVRDITRFTNSIEKNMLEKEINKFTNRRMAYPYGADFSRSLIGSYKFGALRSGANNMTDSLTSDMTVFLTDTDSYYGSTPDGTSEQERAQRANQMFADDFFTGGWEGWLGLTQRDQNNPMGFTMLASQYIAEEQTYENQNVKDELFQNDGFLSQKKCIKWIVYENGEPKMQLNPNYDPQTDIQNEELWIGTYSPTKTTEEDECAIDGYETVTPGSLIKEKVGYYINSPERQTELADGINDVLNAIFTNMVSNFQNNGLPSLASGTYNYTDPNMGQGLGSTYWTEGTNFVNGTNDSSSSGGYTGQMDLTRDLGNTYLHDYNKISLGNWNASTNKIISGDNINGKLYLGLAPKVCDSTEGGRNDCTKLVPADTGYYVVTTAGSTKLFENGFSGWAVGDRAFWNGSEWQNWKKNISNPINKRGVIQIQKDYVVAAKEALQILPSIMPKLGELDYCIPGPNPNFDINYSDTASALSDVVFSLGAEARGTGEDGASKLLFQPKTNGSLGVYQKELGSRFDDATWTETWKLFSDFPSKFYVQSGDWHYPSTNDPEAMEGADYITNYVSKGIMSFANEYKKIIDRIYGNYEAVDFESNELGGMLNEFIKNEKTGEIKSNPNYLPMAQDGLNITKNMTAYDEEITNSIQKYKDDISQADSNTAKLMQIKEYVAVIINAAQARRDAKLLAYLNENKEAACEFQEQQCMGAGGNFTTCHTGYENCMYDTMTMAKYQDIYENCLEEEQIIYYDDLEIMNNTTSAEVNCNDNLDNDLDGVTDQADSDCSGMGNKQCNNGIDDDGDGLKNINDPGCHIGDVMSGTYQPLDDNEFNLLPKKCSDNIDNEGDGTKDAGDENCHEGGDLNLPYFRNHDSEEVSPTITSSFGCRIDETIPPTPAHQTNNTACTYRSEEECTLTKYYYNDLKYTCEFAEL